MVKMSVVVPLTVYLVRSVYSLCATIIDIVGQV